MKELILSLILIVFFSLTSNAQDQNKNSQKDTTSKLMIVEAACGQCKLGLPGKSCDLAVRIDGKAYFVEGTTIDEHGDAHSETGFCNAIRKAEVKGKVVEDRFKLISFKLLPVKKK